MRKKYNDDFYNFVKQNIKGTHISDLAEKINIQFGMNITKDQLSRYCCRFHLTNGINCRFKKGDIPPNKGQKMPAEIYEKCKKTMFKKGNIPQNHKPIGTERTEKDGYIYIKVAEPNKWLLKHRYLWEQANGPTPPGCIITFLDGNKENFNIENLACISRAENAVLNHLNLRTDDKEMTNISINIAKIKVKTRKILKNRKVKNERQSV